MTHPIPFDDLDATDAELASLDALIALGDDADAGAFAEWFTSTSLVDFKSWLLALPDVDDNLPEAA